MKATVCSLMELWMICSGQIYAQSAAAEKEAAAILELGGAGSRDLNEARWSFGPTIAVEVEPIERWLELEAGITPLFSRRSTEWSLDLLFKKPWSLSKRVEVMVGIGPEWIHVRRSGVAANAIAGEAAADFMFWSSGKHRFGWYMEPGYEYEFGRRHERSIGMTVGLLIAIR